MQILTIDIGTGTQDIYLLRTGLSLENGYKLVMPSPTMIIRHQIQDATRRGETLLLTGVTMGGGPSHWAAEAHLRAGYKLFATPEAAQTFNDDLQLVKEEIGVTIVSQDEVAHLKAVSQIDLGDFDFEVISRGEADMVDEIRRKVGLGKEGGGYIYHSDHSVPPKVSLDEYRKVLDLVREHGRY